MLGIGRVMSGKTTATQSSGPTRSANGGPERGDRSDRRTASASSASATGSLGSTTTASSGTSTAKPSVP